MMLIQRGYRFRLYPTAEQVQALDNIFGQARWVYNHYLRARQVAYRLTGKGLSYIQTAAMLARLKATQRYAWLRGAPSQVLQQSLRNLDAAFQNFFAGRTGYPHFRRKHDRQAVRFTNQGARVYGSGRRARLHLAKLGAVQMVAHKPITGRMLNVTVSRTKTGQFYASVCVACEIEPPQPFGGETHAPASWAGVGLDLGLTSFAVTSAGEKIASPRHLRGAERRLKRLQRELSRRANGSHNQVKARFALARQHEAVAARRADFLHQLSRRLVRDNQLIGVEDLYVAGLLSNHCLAKGIADAGWGEFIRQLAYKGLWYGCRVVPIGRFEPTSQVCSICGRRHPGLTLADRTWLCECGARHDRDINAAVNILNCARERLARSHACGEAIPPAAAGASRKQESVSWVITAMKSESPNIQEARPANTAAARS